MLETAPITHLLLFPYHLCAKISVCCFLVSQIWLENQSYIPTYFMLHVTRYLRWRYSGLTEESEHTKTTCIKVIRLFCVLMIYLSAYFNCYISPLFSLYSFTFFVFLIHQSFCF
ncbi:hypothetical protein HanPI659440_Chr17g0664191 [Helianthus annuus]|nr:hypothetical protein HanPI659440_Chr17g0664191 [Helianthus annuus]